MNKSNDICVSIVIPIYNRSTVIMRTIESIKKQTFMSWECIVVDDCSTDNTWEVIEKLIKNDNRFQLKSNNRKKGAQGARNTGILNAKGDYVVLFDSDNIMHPNFLEMVYNGIIKNGVDVCACFSTVIDEQTRNRIGTFRWEGYGYTHKNLLKRKSYFDNSSTLIKKQKLLDIGLLDENCPSFQEWDTHLRLSNIATYFTIKKELVDYYKGGFDTISKNLERNILGQMFILNKFKHDFLKHALFSYVKFNLFLYAEIMSMPNLEDKFHLQEIYKNKCNFFFHLIIKGGYVLLKNKMFKKY